MKKSLMFVLVLLCMSSLVAGMAYTMVNVTTESQITLSAAGDAMLAFNVTEDNDGTFAIDSNEKVLMKFNSQNSKGVHGIQPNSEYSWYDQLKLTNNSNEDVQVTLSNVGELLNNPNAKMTIMSYMDRGNSSDDVTLLRYGTKTDEKLVIPAGETVSLTVHIRVGAITNVEAIEDINANIVFNAQKKQ